MSQQGPNSPSSAADVDVTGNVAWQNPGNTFASDDTYATATLTNSVGSNETHYLYLTGFGFSIPNGETITGVLVEIERRASAAGVRDGTVQLLKANSPAGDSKAAAQDWQQSESYTPFGGNGDLWGTTLDSGDVNDTGFGVALQIVNVGAGDADLYVDHARITVYYGEGGSVQRMLLNVGE